MAGDDDVGDVVNFLEGFLGGGEIEGVGEDLAGEEMVLSGDGVAGDEDGHGGLGEEQAAAAGGEAEEGKQVDAWGDFVGGGFEGMEQLDFIFESNAIFITFGQLGNQFLGALAGGGSLGFVQKDSGVREKRKTAAVGGAEIGEKDGVDLVGIQACALGESSA